MADLFGDDADEIPKPKHGRQPKPKAEPKSDGAVQRCVAWFYEQYARRWSPPAAVAEWEMRTSRVNGDEVTALDRIWKAPGLVTPLVAWGKHGKKFRELLDAWDEPTVIELVTLFFRTSDPAITTSDYSLDAFFAKVNRLRLNKAGRPAISDRMRANLAAAARATGRKE